MPRLFVHNLTVIDFAYLHGERGLLGESWQVHVELGGALDEQGMVFDFAHVKKGIKSILDRELDHRLLVASNDSIRTVARWPHPAPLAAVGSGADRRALDHAGFREPGGEGTHSAPVAA